MRGRRARITRRSFLETLEQRLALAAVAWDGGGDGTSWTDAANWSEDLLPELDDDVTIDVAGSPTITLSSGTQSIRSLVSNANLTLSGGSLQVSAASQVNGNVSLSGGALAGTGDFTVSGSLLWTSGAMAGSGRTIIASSGTLSMPAISGTARSLQRVLENNGTATWTASTLPMNGGTFINNGSFTASFNLSLSTSGTGVFYNNGSYTKLGIGNNSFASGIAFHNAGAISVEAGTLSLNGGGSHTGDFGGLAGATLMLQGTHTFAATADVNTGGNIAAFGTSIFEGNLTAGSLLVNAGTITINGTASISAGTQGGGLINGSGDLSLLGTFTWNGGTMNGTGRTIVAEGATMTISGGTHGLQRLLENHGTVNFTDGTILSSAVVGTIYNHVGGVFNVIGEGDFLDGGTGTAVFNNAGRFTHSGFGNTVFSGQNEFAGDTGQWLFNNSGTIDIIEGTVTFGGGSTSDSSPPTSSVNSLPDNVDPGDLLVRWSGFDNETGVAFYDIFVSIDGGAFTLWLSHTESTSALYTVDAPHTYAFYSVAVDFLGNREAAPATPDAVVSVGQQEQNQPPVFEPIADQVANEGTLLVVPLSVHDPDGNPVTVTASFGTIRQNEDGSWTYLLGAVDGPVTYPVTITADDGAGGVVSRSFTVTILNAGPFANNEEFFGVQGFAIFGNVLANDFDPAGANDVLTIAGTTYTPNGFLTLNPDGSFIYVPKTTFSGADSFTYTISDGEGGFATATATFHIQRIAGGVYPVFDTLGGIALIINGTDGDDLIVVGKGNDQYTVMVTFNQYKFPLAKPTGRVIVTGGLGNDILQITADVPNPAWVYGEAGNDRLLSGRGASLLIGGDGNDELHGGGGRDILIGGFGADRIKGNAGDDILVAGGTWFDDRGFGWHEVFWQNLLREWNSGNSFKVRVQNLRDGSGGNAFNYGSSLTANYVDDLVTDDIDFLNGASGYDWFIFRPGQDKVAGKIEAWDAPSEQYWLNGVLSPTL
jgi:hypothetical protein